jgi:hypothetical protein
MSDGGPTTIAKGKLVDQTRNQPEVKISTKERPPPQPYQENISILKPWVGKELTTWKS